MHYGWNCDLNKTVWLHKEYSNCSMFQKSSESYMTSEKKPKFCRKTLYCQTPFGICRSSNSIPYTCILTLCGMELFNKFNILLKSSKNKCLMDVFKAWVDLHNTCEVTADSPLFYIPIIHIGWNSFSIITILQ